MTELGRFNPDGSITSVEVPQEELGINCWRASRFLGGYCDRYHRCKYPEKETCKANSTKKRR